MRRSVLMVFLLLLAGSLMAQIDRWSWGAYVGIEISRLMISAEGAPSQISTINASPPFGLYLRSPETAPNMIEIQAGYEIVGSNREIFFERAQYEFVHINDRFASLPLNVQWFHHLGKSGKLWLGIGGKGQLVVDSYTRHHNPLPVGTTGFIYNPEINKFYASATAELMYQLPFADLCLHANYAFTPVINSENVKVVPVSLSFTVKKHMVAGGRYGEF